MLDDFGVWSIAIAIVAILVVGIILLMFGIQMLLLLMGWVV